MPFGFIFHSLCTHHCTLCCLCQDPDRSGDVGVFDGRHCGLPGLLSGWTGRPAEWGGEGKTHLMKSLYVLILWLCVCLQHNRKLLFTPWSKTNDCQTKIRLCLHSCFSNINLKTFSSYTITQPVWYVSTLPHWLKWMFFQKKSVWLLRAWCCLNDSCLWGELHCILLVIRTNHETPTLDKYSAYLSS